MRHKTPDSVILFICAAVLTGFNMLLYGAAEGEEYVFLCLGLMVFFAAGTLYIMKKTPYPVIVKGSLVLYGIAAALMVIVYMIRNGDTGMSYRIGALHITSLSGLFLYAAAYLTGKYRTYEGFRAGIPVLLILIVPVFLMMLSWDMMQVIAFAVSVALYANILKKEQKFDSFITGLAGALGILVTGVIFLAPVILPKMPVIGTYWEYRMEGIGMIREALSHMKIIGISDWRIESMNVTAVQYFLWYLYSCFGPAAVSVGGWLPFAGLVCAALLLVRKVFERAKKAAGQYARYFAWAAGSYFAVRTLLSLSVFVTGIPGGFHMPFTGDLCTMISDTVLLCGMYALSGKEDPEEEGLLNRERSVYSVLDTLSESMHAKLDVMKKELGLEGDEEFDDWEDDGYDPAEQYPDRRDARTEEFRRLWKRVTELDEDRRELENHELAEREAAVKYAADIAENTVPETYKRNLVFFSYNHSDADVVRHLSLLIEKQGIPTWYYQKETIAGMYGGEIIRAMKKSKIFIVILSENANRSTEVAFEVANAGQMVRDGLILMPLDIEKITMNDDLLYYLSSPEHAYALTRPMTRSLEEFADRVCAVYRKSMGEQS